MQSDYLMDQFNVNDVARSLTDSFVEFIDTYKKHRSRRTKSMFLKYIQRKGTFKRIKTDFLINSFAFNCSSKSAPVSVNRSESYKETLTHARSRNRRKTSDPSLSKTR